MTVNKVILVGNLGRDPETRSTQSGMTVATLSVATTERTKQADGEWGDHTEWHRVAVFGKTAETAARYLTKGRQVYIEGKLRTRKYTDRNGIEKYSTEVLADQVRFLGGAPGGGGGGAPSGGGGGAPSAGGGGAPSGGGGAPSGGGGAPSGGGYGGGASDDDIPF